MMPNDAITHFMNRIADDMQSVKRILNNHGATLSERSVRRIENRLLVLHEELERITEMAVCPELH